MTKKLNIIVQAGGRGSRLRHHTWNKPKCLVSVDGKPILYHLFEKFPSAKFIVICDYAFETLETYLKVNRPAAEHELVRATGKGTISGIPEALARLEENAPFLIVWSDLSFTQPIEIPTGDLPIIIKTNAFPCRWSVAPDESLREKTSSTGGIPGIFYFPNKKCLEALPSQGEFVKWLSKNLTKFKTTNHDGLKELGEFAMIEAANDRQGFSRFFNQVEIGEELVTKTVIDPAYHHVHENEIAWYRAAVKLGFGRVPKIDAEHPLVMERIKGRHAYQMTDLTEREQRAVLCDYLDTLEALHSKEKSESNLTDLRTVYLDKTKSRVNEVSQLIPGFFKDSTTINGKKCRNIFHEKHGSVLDQIFPKLITEHFVPIHGDPTFSNTLVDESLRVWFIDPRGYFAQPGIMGDPWYDYAKVYYSAVGGYDNFNRRKFKLYIDDDTVEILMDEPILKQTAKQIFKQYFPSDMARINIIHGLIWLALSGYAKDDIDSVIGSYYQGLYWLELGLQEL